MSWLPKRDKLDPVQASEYPPAVRPLAKQVARVVLISPLRRRGRADLTRVRDKRYTNRFLFGGSEYFIRFTIREIGKDSSVHASTISDVAVYRKTEDARPDSHPENPEDEHTASFIDNKVAYYLNAVNGGARNLDVSDMAI